MSALLTVSTDDLHDLVASACREQGCDDGVSQRIARNVVFAEIHYGRAIDAIVAHLSDHRFARSAFARAPERVAQAAASVEEVDEASTVVTLDPAAPIAALAHELWVAILHGVVPVGIDADAHGATELRELRLDRHVATEESIDAVRNRTDGADEAGLLVDRSLHSQLEGAAGRR